MKGKALLWVVLLAVAAGAVYFFIWPGDDEEPGGIVASGTVEATEAHLAFAAPGRIESIRVREGDRVTEGMELARLDQQELLAQSAEARARIEAAKARLEELRSGFREEEIAQAGAALAAARHRVVDAERDLERTKRLFEGGAVSREAFDKAELALDLARSELEQAQERRKLFERGPRPEQIAAQQAELNRAEAALEVIEAALDNRILRAPFEGIVTVRHREPGETVPAGSAVLTILDPADRWVRIYVREDRIGAVHLGTEATIRSDTYPDKTYPGEVSFIASEAEFTPKNVQTAEERVKLVYAVKVRIEDDPSRELKPGMPADVRLDVSLP